MSYTKREALLAKQAEEHERLNPREPIEITPSNIVPFGKYKGQPIAALLADHEYVAWCRQNGLVEKYPQAFNINYTVVQQYAEPPETPAHNAIQLLFLDDVFAKSVYCLAYGYKSIAVVGPDGNDWCYPTSGPQFEVSGFDVLFKYDEGTRGYFVGIELKTTMGDDYPAVLRQIQAASERTRCEYINGVRRMYPRQGSVSAHITAACVIEQWTSTNVSLEQVTKLFKMSGVVLLTVDQVKAFTKVVPDTGEQE